MIIEYENELDLTVEVREVLSIPQIVLVSMESEPFE
jgi:hypothetical protein